MEVKTDNIGLFAAGPRRPQTKPVQPATPTPPPPSDPDSNNDGVVHDKKRSVEDMASSPGARNSKNELRAELMRLEAEREQLEIDRQRIDQDKVCDHLRDVHH